MLKPFITFTKTDATRLYNNAETKNVVIGYLQEHGFIKQIDDLFLSNIPTKKKIKSEIGYLKLFPASHLAAETTLFEMKLREKIGITLDEYVDKIFNGVNPSMSTSAINNVFNTAHHSWLFNRIWYHKLKEGEINVYIKNKVMCPDEQISLPAVMVTTVSDDNGNISFHFVSFGFMYHVCFLYLVHDSSDRPRSNLTASQRTNKELRRLGIKRQKQPSEEPPPKRQRKPKRFPEDD